MGPVCFFCIWLKVKYPALGKKKTLDGRHQLVIREKRSDPTLTTLSSPGPLLLEREREPFKVHYSMIEVQYFYRSTEAYRKLVI